MYTHTHRCNIYTHMHTNVHSTHHVHTCTHMHTHVHIDVHNHCTQMYANLLWRERGSNPRRADYDSTVLPTELSRQRIVQSKHIVSLYLRMRKSQTCTKILMHNDIYIWSLWYVCLFVHCTPKCTKCVQFAFNLHVHILYTQYICVYIHICWSKRIRTFASRNQKPTPFHLAILHTTCLCIWCNALT